MAHLGPRAGSPLPALEVPIKAAGLRELTAGSVAWDAWRATHGGPTAIASRQVVRLAALLQHAHRASRFYADHYRELPPGPIGAELFYRLPPVTKSELMAHFDDWG
jgi:hypothetical protein